MPRTLIRPLTLLLALSPACSTDYGVAAKVDPEYEGEPPELLELDPPTDIQNSSPGSCPADLELPDRVSVDEDCMVERVEGALNAELKWEISRWSNYGESSQVVMAPLVGQLTDDNADGRVDEDDIPDIVVITDDEGDREGKRGILRFMSGDGTSMGAAIQRVDVDFGVPLQVYPYRYANAAIGDIDLDGTAEIVTIVEVAEGEIEVPDTGSGVVPPDTGPDETGGVEEEDIPVAPGGTPARCFVAAFTPEGTVKWLGLDAVLPCGGHAPALADLEADGSIEVVVGRFVLAGDSGALVWSGRGGAGAYASHPEVGWMSVPMDLDGDGLMEVATGQTIYDAYGETRCETDDSELDGFVGIADFDHDGRGEVLSIGNTQARIVDSDCVEVARFPLVGSGNGGPPTIGDFDRDGSPEIGVATGTAYAVYEPDGTILWANPIDDESSAVTGSSAYDFEGDGQLEVVYADESRLWIFDGSTGEVRYSSDRHASRTLHELPTVADVNGDGEVEVLIPNGGGHGGENRTGIWVLGSTDGSWLPARSMWNQHAFSYTNIEDDLAIPSPAQPNWPLYNSFRSGSPLPTTDGFAADIVPVADLCNDDCEDGWLVVYVRLGNAGVNPTRRDLPISLYAQDISGYRTRLGSDRLGGEILSGATSPTVRLRIDWSGYSGQDLVVVADDDGYRGWLPECTEANNELVFPTPDCDA